MASGPNDVQRWQAAFMSEAGPHATVRYILLTLSVRMTKNGDRAFPSLVELVKRTKLTEPTLVSRLRQARDESWLLVLDCKGLRRDGRRRGARGHQYLPSIPGQSLKEVEELLAELIQQGASIKRSGDAGASAVSGTEGRSETSAEASAGTTESPLGIALNIVQPSSPGRSSSSSSSKPSSRPLSSSNCSPQSRAARGRDGTATHWPQAKDVLVRHCLLGSDQHVDQYGQRIGVGLLHDQLKEFVDRGYTLEELIGAVTQVRGDEDAPPPSAAFSLRWFDGHPGRLARCIGAYHKGLQPKPTPVTAALSTAGSVLQAVLKGVRGIGR